MTDEQRRMIQKHLPLVIRRKQVEQKNDLN